MPYIIRVVAAIGRDSMGDAATRAVIEQVAGKKGGKVGSGVGSSSDPILVEFATKEAAVSAAQELWYDDAVEAVRVDANDVLPTAAVQESVDAASTVMAVAVGGDVKTAIDSLIEAKKKAKKEKDGKEKEDKGDKEKGGKKEKECDEKVATPAAADPAAVVSEALKSLTPDQIKALMEQALSAKPAEKAAEKPADEPKK